MDNHKEYHKGEGGGFPQVWVMVSLVYGSFVHHKCSNYALTNILFDLCKFMWIIDQFVTCLSPHLEVPMRLFTREVLQVKEHIPIPSSFVVSPFQLAYEFYKEFGGV